MTRENGREKQKKKKKKTVNERGVNCGIKGENINEMEETKHENGRGKSLLNLTTKQETGKSKNEK